VTDPHVAAQRLRAYLRRLPDAANLGATVESGPEFTAANGRPAGFYALDRGDLEAVLDALDQLHGRAAQPRVTSHTYEGTPGPGNPCETERFGQACGEPWEQHELRDELGAD
jgi:hypothetical protein